MTFLENPHRRRGPAHAGSACVFFPRTAGKADAGFSLVELLTVLAIVSILSSLILMSISGVKGSRDLAKAAYDIQGVLEQARTMAMASDTYTWVGFFEEDPTKPGTAGTGQVVISVVSSASGTNPDSIASPIATLPSSGLTQVNKLIKIPNVHLAAVPTTAVTRPTTPINYQVGSSAFANTTQLLYPLTAATPSAAQYAFSQIIQFSPQGDATRIADNPTPLIEIGLQPAHGNTTGTTGPNFAVVQVAGIGGQVTTYRP